MTLSSDDGGLAEGGAAAGSPVVIKIRTFDGDGSYLSYCSLTITVKRKVTADNSAVTDQVVSSYTALPSGGGPFTLGGGGLVNSKPGEWNGAFYQDNTYAGTYIYRVDVTASHPGYITKTVNKTIGKGSAAGGFTIDVVLLDDPAAQSAATATQVATDTGNTAGVVLRSTTTSITNSKLP